MTVKRGDGRQIRWEVAEVKKRDWVNEDERIREWSEAIEREG